MKRSRLLLCAILIFLVIISFAACNGKQLKTGSTAIQHEEKFGGVYIEITIDDFNNMGFAFGDAVKIEFSNGFVLEEIPYYNGFYVDMGDPLLVGYPGYPYIRVGYNNGPDMYKEANLQLGADTPILSLTQEANLDVEHDTAVITLIKKGKYLATQNAMDIHYSDEQNGRPDAVFANFREVNVGRLKDNTLYRSASPCDNQHKRAEAADRLISAAGVNCIINLADSEADLIKHAQAINEGQYSCPQFLSIYNAGNVIPLSMNMAYKTDGFNQKLVSGLTAAAHKSGPYLVHCVEGKDRTGFVCMVIEGLSGATYEEIVADYMVTYDNYYGINKTSDPDKYDVIKDKQIDTMLRYVTGDNGADITKADYSACIKNYLLRIGMAQSDIDALENNFASVA